MLRSVDRALNEAAQVAPVPNARRRGRADGLFRPRLEPVEVTTDLGTPPASARKSPQYVWTSSRPWRLLSDDEKKAAAMAGADLLADD